MSKVLELRSKRAKLWEQTKNFLEDHRNENGLVDASAVAEYEKMANDVKALGVEIERLEAQEAIDNKMSEATTKPVMTEPMMDREAVKKMNDEKYSRAFWNMIRGDMSYEVRNDLNVKTPAEGGYTVPDEFERQLIQALEVNNFFRQIAHVIRTSSGTHKIPVARDTEEAQWVDEGEKINTADTSFDQTSLSAYKLATSIKISNELLHDSAFDLPSYIAERFGIRMGKAEEKAFIIGTGKNQPTGLLNDAGGAQTGHTAAKEDAITFDDIFALYYSLKAPYRAKAKFICNETTVLKLMTLKDSNGNYLWKPSLDIAKPDTILGRPVITTPYMPEAKAGQKAVAFGDFSYYWIADRQGRTFRRLNELYAETDQVGFITTQRVDGKLVLPEAVQILKMGGTAANEAAG